MTFENMRKPLDSAEASFGGHAELPTAHTEGLDKAGLEKLSDGERYQQIGAHYYENELRGSPGLMRAFQEAGGKSPAEFAQQYSAFVLGSEKMRDTNAPMYAFFKDRIFFGRDFEHSSESGGAPVDTETARHMEMRREAADPISFRAGLGIGAMERLTGDMKIDQARNKEASAGYLEAKAKNAANYGDLKKANELKSEAASLHRQSKALEQEGRKILNKYK